MKKKLIATAVAGALVAPAAMAASHASVVPYFRINNALSIVDSDAPGADTTADIANVSSRIGIRGSSDLGNGTTVFGQYEFSTFTDIEGAAGGRGGINDTRIAIVGMRGSFGSISVGNQWSAFYNTVGSWMDPTYTLGGVVYFGAGGIYRESNAVKYANSFGAVSVEVDTRFSQDNPATNGADVEAVGADNGEDFLDGFGIGVSFDVSDAIALRAAYDSELYSVGDDLNRLGLAARASFGGFWVSAGFMDVDQGSAGIDSQLITVYAGTSFGENTGAYVGYLTNDFGNGTDPSQIILHADHKVGGGPLRIFYEGTFFDADNVTPTTFDFSQHLFGMRIDL